MLSKLSLQRLKIVLSLLLGLWVLLYFNLSEIDSIFKNSPLSESLPKPLFDALSFFFYEVPKVFLLLLLIVFVAGVVRSFFPPEKTRALLSGKSLFFGNVSAASLGIVTPFCSCSAIPLFLGFVSSGVPLGVTFSFLISAPMVNEVALVLLLELFGWQTALLYLSTGLSIAIVAGFIIGKLKLESWVEPWVYESGINSEEYKPEQTTFQERIAAGEDAVKDIFKKIWLYIILGIALGAGIHGIVPENMLAGFMGKDAWWSVPLAVILGIPMYSNAAGIIPIVQSLLAKGASLGTVLAFMMSVIALSLPEMLILRNVLKLQLIAVFAGVVGFGIMVVGFLFNLVL